MNQWIAAAIAIVAGLVIGSIAGRFARRALGAPARPEALRQVAAPAGSFVFAIAAAAGLLVAIGIASPDSLETLPRSLVSFFPKVLVAGVLLLIANVAGSLAAVAVRSALVRATGEARPGPPRLVRVAILATGVMLAVGQLGVNTTIVNLAVAAILLTTGVTAAILIGLGGLEVARHLAAGRLVGRIVPVGAQIECAAASGIVRAIHPATIEIAQPDGSVIHVPHAAVLAGSIRVSGEASQI